MTTFTDGERRMWGYTVSQISRTGPSTAVGGQVACGKRDLTAAAQWVHLFLTRPRLADHMADGVTVQQRANAVFAAMLEGTLTVAIEGHYTLETLQQVHERIEARQQIGKAVVWVDRELH
ncbi:zinc-binding alcohol dehydrogenase family protein [Pseudomonas sp. SJZ103]|uniref:zinc-binding dehydrogenase n=1 Tax=Pseudomonas sp. JAI120 TaxID=2723063 RepID=UPI0011AD9211|nr:zinc-binding alcohol dehydrogenase family protein [Pseudomonas sp. SJZ103]TWC82882.1 zinc-binding alcohol dehydrogenase family protein [Pseudomonas sp. SJZ094]